MLLDVYVSVVKWSGHALFTLVFLETVLDIHYIQIEEFTKRIYLWGMSVTNFFSFSLNGQLLHVTESMSTTTII